MSLKYFMC
uniref:Uncharacterized protein n=1 Tax=Arundo donax TaxID=35708 RepID=A0A0A9A0B7_ARUDO